MTDIARRQTGWKPAKETVSVIVAYFGDRGTWEPLVLRACISVEKQTVQVELLVSYGETLKDARNDAAWVATGDYLIFLDADDELDSRYVESMLGVYGDIRQPSTLGVVDGVEDDAPVLIPKKSLLLGNYIVIGAMVLRDFFVRVGGFDDLPVAEDWSLWLRCWIEGAQITECPNAIYKVHVRPGSRNQQPGLGDIYSNLRQRYIQEARARGLV